VIRRLPCLTSLTARSGLSVLMTLCLALQILMPGMHALNHHEGHAAAPEDVISLPLSSPADHEADCPVCVLLQHVVHESLMPGSTMVARTVVGEAWGMLVERVEVHRRPDVRATSPRGPPLG